MPATPLAAPQLCSVFFAGCLHINKSWPTRVSLSFIREGSELALTLIFEVQYSAIVVAFEKCGITSRACFNLQMNSEVAAVDSFDYN